MNCKEATALSVRRAEEKISVADQLRLKLHLFLCSYCKIFDRQNKLINILLQNRSNNKPLSTEEKEVLKSTIIKAK
jgi:hypothetical protein